MLKDIKDINVFCVVVFNIIYNLVLIKNLKIG